ncbi:MAG TPA: cation:proton antiporter [Solirubrobacteraceae bacterium]|nr:cation:proton antiporter [Solirubrobacteraceae bacterium]
MNFETLVVIVLAGLGGPLLGVVQHRFVPVVAGEILAGILVGPHVIGAVDPAKGTISFLSEVGFAMLMLTAGMHLPLRDARLAAAARVGFARAAAVCLLALPAGLLAAAVAGGGHAAVYAVVLASGSAAVLLPAFEEAGLDGTEAIAVIAQVTIADVLTILSVPVVLEPSRIGHAALGTAYVLGAAAALLALARTLAGSSWIDHVRHLSKRRHWALDLRVSLIVLFLLAWLAQEGGTSILVAGFGAGVMVALIGGPKRLSTQVRGIADGFFVPLYFVVLGARLDISGLAEEPSLIALAAALVLLNVLLHVLVTVALRGRAASGLAATAQLGVPAAVASIGLSQHVLSATTATAIVLAALASVAVATLGVELLAAREGREPPATAPVARA